MRKEGAGGERESAWREKGKITDGTFSRGKERLLELKWKQGRIFNFKHRISLLLSFLRLPPLPPFHFKMNSI